MRVALGLILAACMAFALPFAALLQAQTQRDFVDDTAYAASAGIRVAGVVREFTPISFCPVLGISVVGALTYFTTPPEERDSLPFYFQPWFVGLCALLALAFVVKTSGLQLMPPVKKLVDALASATSNFSVLILFVPVMHRTWTQIRGARLSVSGIPGFETVAYAADGAATPAGETPWFLAVILLVFAAVAYWALWLLGNLINALILANPIPFLDIILVALVVGVMGGLGLAYWIHPLLGLAFSLVLIAFALWIARWAFRWSLLATVFSWDILTFRKDRRWGARGLLRAFSGPAIADVPLRTMGRFRIVPNGEHRFEYRKWVIGPVQSVAVSRASLEVGCGLAYASLIRRRSPSEYAITARLAPRYRGAETAIAKAVGVPCCDIGMRRGLAAAFRWVKEQLVPAGPAASGATP